MYFKEITLRMEMENGECVKETKQKNSKETKTVKDHQLVLDTAIISHTAVVLQQAPKENSRRHIKLRKI